MPGQTLCIDVTREEDGMGGFRCRGRAFLKFAERPRESGVSVLAKPCARKKVRETSTSKYQRHYNHFSAILKRRNYGKAPQIRNTTESSQ